MKQKKKGNGLVLWSILTCLSLILCLAGNYGIKLAFDSEQAVNIALKTPTHKQVGGDPEAIYYPSDFASVEELEAHGRKVAEQLHAEGVVLLKNDGNTLPLTGSEAVSTLGHSSVNVASCGTGSADIDTSKGPNLKEALESRGFTVNPTLWDFYATGAGSQYPSVPVKGMSGMDGNRKNYHVNEVPTSVYTDEVRASFAEYNDAAIVTITRLSGELFDVPVDGFVDGVNALELTQAEKDLLVMAKENYDKVIVLLNSTNAMECDFLFDDTYGVDAALWIGYTGAWGLNSVADILAGNVNPSGRLVDTYCLDNTTNPAMVGIYAQQYTNVENGDPRWYPAITSLDGNGSYITYQEGIYVGYRYYETRYEDVVMGTGNAGDYDYGATVAYPFGYGLSYTSFDWSDFTSSYNAGTDSFDLTVKVTNTGSAAGKEVVQIYCQSPYTDYDKKNGIEKAAVELCGFAKTQILEPGDSETVSVTVPRSELTSYDRKGAKTYILEAGDYYLTAGRNAHDAVNNILAAKGFTGDAAGNTDMVSPYTVATTDKTTYSTSAATGYEITNQFDDAELSYYGVDANFLSRSDWQKTWPELVTLEASDAMLDQLYIYQTYQSPADSTAEMPTMGADNGMTLGMMIGKDFNDPDWDKLLDQATFEEMATLIGKGYHNTAMMMSVSKPATLDDNGPQGFSQALTGVTTCHTAYSDENIMAATYNVDLMYEMGRALGNDMLDLGATGLYGPAMNIHRNAYAGRNFEYYSEDPFLSGAIAAAEVEGIQSKGVYVYIKHFALNDSETSCRCISTWTNEQAIREIYLKPFEMAVVDGGAYNVMNSFARFGATWSGAHYGLMTNVLRNEWGMRGFGLTDFSGNSQLASYGMFLKTYDVAHGLMAGTDSWDSSAAQWTDDLNTLYRDNADIAQAMRGATHRILYTVVNSHAMNGIDADTRIVKATPWWKPALIVVDVILIAFTVTCVVMLVRKLRARKASKAQNL